MSDFESHPPLGLTPITGSEQQGAEETSETSPQATSEETVVHPEASEDAGDSQNESEESTSTAADEPEVFYEEGGKKFFSFEEYRDHTNKQRGAAARIAHEKNLAEQAKQQAIEEAQRYKDLLDKALSGNAKDPVEEEDPEVVAAMDALRKKGFMTRDEFDSLLQEKIAPFKKHSERLEQQQIAQAKAVVDEFISLNPDTIQYGDEIQRTLKVLEEAGLPGGIEKAYFMVTNRQPKTKATVVDATKQQVKAVKAAQAGGATSPVATGEKAERDIFDSMIFKV